MNINALDLLNQLKKFFIQERWSYFSLFLYFLVWLYITNIILPIIKDYNIPYINIIIYIVMISIVLVLWIYSRVINLDKNKTNIWIANIFPLVIWQINITADQKMTISQESANTIYSNLNHNIQKIWIEKYINTIRLPWRYEVNYGNADQISKETNVEFAIRWTIKVKENISYLNYKIWVWKAIKSKLFDSIIDSINIYPEIVFDFDSKNLMFEKFIHQVIYLWLVYQCCILSNNWEYIESNKLSDFIISNIYKLYEDKSDQSVNAGDDDFMKIELLLYTIISNNYYSLSNDDTKNKDNHILSWLEYSKKQLEFLRKIYKNNKNNTFDIHDLEKEIIYQIGKICSYDQNANLDKIMHKFDTESINNYYLDIKWFVQNKYKDSESAEKTYKEAINNNPEDILAIRWLAILYYENWEYSKAIQTWKKLLSITKFHPFYEWAFDITIIKILWNSYLRIYNIPKAIYYKALFYYKIHQNNKNQNIYI